MLLISLFPLEKKPRHIFNKFNEIDEKKMGFVPKTAKYLQNRRA